MPCRCFASVFALCMRMVRFATRWSCSHVCVLFAVLVCLSSRPVRSVCKSHERQLQRAVQRWFLLCCRVTELLCCAVWQCHCILPRGL
jgi:hypothetical protein